MAAMFKGSKTGSAEHVDCVCDECATSIRLGARLGDTDKEINNLPSVLRNLQKRGWSNIKSVLRCPQCEAKRKAPKDPTTPLGDVLSSWDAEDKQQEPEMTTQVELRQPTKEQKREILAMLDIAYDAAAQRYKGSDTDQSVAEALGSNILWGWVSALREEFYGPDGNEDADLLLKSVAEWQDKADKAYADAAAKLEEARVFLTEMDAAKAEVAKLAAAVAKLTKNGKRT